MMICIYARVCTCVCMYVHIEPLGKSIVRCITAYGSMRCEKVTEIKTLLRHSEVALSNKKRLLYARIHYLCVGIYTYARKLTPICTDHDHLCFQVGDAYNLRT